MEVFTAASLAALVLKVTSMLKYLSAGQVRQAVTQLVPWVAGVAAVAIAAQADVAAGLTVFGDHPLGSLDVWSIMLAGIALGSDSSVAYDFKKARDNTDSAAEPPLAGPN